MKRMPFAAVSLAFLAGCSTVGLSPRETAQQNYSSFLYSLYDLPTTEAGAPEELPRRRLREQGTLVAHGALSCPCPAPSPCRERRRRSRAG